MHASLIFVRLEALEQVFGIMRVGSSYGSICAKLILSLAWFRSKGLESSFITDPERVYGTMGGSDYYWYKGLSSPN